MGLHISNYHTGIGLHIDDKGSKLRIIVINGNLIMRAHNQEIGKATDVVRLIFSSTEDMERIVNEVRHSIRMLTRSIHVRFQWFLDDGAGMLVIKARGKKLIIEIKNHKQTPIVELAFSHEKAEELLKDLKEKVASIQLLRFQTNPANYSYVKSDKSVDDRLTEIEESLKKINESIKALEVRCTKGLYDFT